ncbi:MAG: VCBS repeat-containing protein [Cyclobacteriaceae bacterium]|nr:VCBS repeat-containing protein [Cyclobacteriaceae bacterium]
MFKNRQLNLFALLPVLWLFSCGPKKTNNPPELLSADTTTLKDHSSWPRHTIDNSSSGADGVKLADINNDGLPDIATGWEEGGITKLYLHPGKDKVKEEWPSVVVGPTPDVEDAVFADMNNDGQMEVVSCSEGKTRKIFVHRQGDGDILDPENWSQEVLPPSDGLMMWMYAEPLQVDGQHGPDLIAAGKGEGAGIGWFEAPRDPGDMDGWKWHEISPVGWVMSIILEDMDNDGDVDIIITDRKGPNAGCRWLVNPGPGQDQKKPWESRTIGAAGLEVMFMSLTDLDGDGRKEAIVTERTHETTRVYKRNNAAEEAWKEITISLPETTGRAKSVEVGDIDGDGTNDLVHSTNTYGKEINGLTWTSGKDGFSEFHGISGPHNAKYDKAELMDIDGDGDLDVLICEENYGEDSEGLGVVWYENPAKF